MQLPRELILVRHGESEGNVANRASRAGDHSHFTPGFRMRPSSSWHLSKNGEKQAMKAGAWLRNSGNLPKLDVVFVSPYYRASETLFFMGPEFYKDVTNSESHLVRERDWGLLDVLPDPELKIAYDGCVAGRDEDPFFWTPPGGESIAHVVERARRFMDGLSHLCTRSERVMVVCHGEMMWAFRVLLEHLSPETYADWHHSKAPGHKIYNCHVLHYRRQADETKFSRLRSVCTYDPDRYDSKWRLIKRPRELI